MAKKPAVKLKDIEKAIKTLKALNVQLLKADSGEIYLLTKPPGRGLELQEYSSKTACAEVKYIARQSNVDLPEYLIYEALGTLRHELKYAEQVQLSRRVAERGDTIYVDLCDTHHRVVEITSSGWKVTTDCAGVYFVRPRAAQSLPVPKQNGTFKPLRELLAILDERSFMLVLGWLFTALRESPAHPFLAINGEPGSAKSSITEFLCRIIDPRDAKSLQLNKEGENLQLTAYNRWVLPLDEVDKLPPDKAQILSAICTGGGFEKKKNYADTETICVSYNRPVVMSGHGSWLEEYRIRDRSIPLLLSRLPPRCSVYDTTLDQRFEACLPDTLGALYSAVSTALRTVQKGVSFTVPHSLRMKEAMEWADLCLTTAGYPVGEFVRAVSEGQDQAAIRAAEEWVLLAPLQKVAETSFSGSATELLALLNRQLGAPTKDRNWPHSAAQLGKAISEHLDDLRKCGVVAEQSQRTSAGRGWNVCLSNPTEKAVLAPLSPKENAEVTRKLGKYASLLDVDWISCLHPDGSHTLCGRSADLGAKALKRPVEEGRTLRVSAAEWGNLEPEGDTLII